MDHVDIVEMVGQVFDSVNADLDEMRFTRDGKGFLFYHPQDCCEYVHIVEIIGDLKDLEGSPLLVAEEVSSDDAPEPDTGSFADSYTWTFYRFQTIKGSVTVRWLGTSNGYYSESVDLVRVG